MRTVAACLVSVSTALVAVGAAAAVGFAGSTPSGRAVTPSVLHVAEAKKPAPCGTDDLSGTIIGNTRRPVRGVWMATMRLTNVSARTCRVEGWPEVALVTPPGDLVPIAVHTVNEPGAATPVDVRPRASAWAGLRWRVCHATARGCGAGVALQFTVDPQADGIAAGFEDFPAAEKDGLTMRSLQVGTFRASRDGLLAW